MTDLYRCVIADPPWAYRNKMESMVSTGDGAAAQYSCMTVEQIEAFMFQIATVKSADGEHRDVLDNLLADDCHLWLWITNAHLLEGAHVAVLKAWDFEPKTIATWVKGRLALNLDAGKMKDAYPELVHHIGQGYYLRNTTEHCIFAVRGRQPARVRNLPTSFVYPARWEGRLHSEKPPIIHEWAEALSPAPRLEIFSRRRRENWDAIGDEL